jgi:hypothetical protein
MKKREAQIVAALDKAIGRIQKRLADEDMKGSVADLVRMLQLRNELVAAQPTQVTVRWVDECQTSSSSTEE